MPVEKSIPYIPFGTEKPRMTATPSIHETLPEVHLNNPVGQALSIVGHGMGTLGEATKTLGHAYGAVGESYGKLGRGLEGAGDELFKRAVALKELEIDKDVDTAAIANYKAQGQNTEEFMKLQGDAATTETYKAHMQQGEKLRQGIEDSLK